MAAAADVWIKPELGMQTGTTDFELTLEQRSNGQDLRVRSLLEWPVNFWLVGLSAGTSLDAFRAADRWLVEGRLDTNLGDAHGKMADSDWISSRSENIRPTRFAFTQSKTESFALLTELTLGYRFGGMFERHHLNVDLLAGMRGEYYSLTAMGAKGSYLDENLDPVKIEIPERTDAADYRVLHLLPFVGCRFVMEPWTFIRVPIAVRVHGLVSYSHDDHVLRRKEAYGNAHGTAVSASIAPELAIVGPLSVGFSGEAFHLTSVSGVLKQEFYGDDPGTPEDERGSSVPNADFAVKSTRFQLMVFGKLSF